MQKLSKLILFLFLFLIISYFKTDISFAITSCPTAKIQCGQLDAGGGCASPCLRVVTSVGGKGPSWCACQEPISPPVPIACGGSCQTSANCGTACAFCRASGPGTGLTCQTSTTDSDEAFPGISFPCGSVHDPEFHSLRPYQAAVCGDANKALYCSNELKFIESFDLTGECPIKGHTSDFDCNPNFNVDEHNLYVELTDSMFPIMGNTEQVKSYSGNEEYDDAQKVNEYASWYLSGVNNRAEYGENTDDRVVNFSGPIQKLLPKMIQEAERIKTINKAAIDGEGWTDDDGITYTTPQNHNQIVVCGDSNLGWFGDLFNIGKITPVPCYGGNEKFRLKDGDGDQGWYDGDLSFWNTIANEIVGKIVTVLPSVPEDIITKSVLNHWNKRTPPFPWEDDPFEKRPMTELEYKKYYNEWQGKTCVIVPLINFLVCFDNILVPNKWADLYQYIPLSNTTDKLGVERILDVRFKPSNGTEIANEKYNEAGKKNAPLYFAHTQEVKESSELLNKTYMPQGYESEPLPETTEKNVCSAVNVRTNKGDDLFPGDRVEGDTKEMIIPGVTYDITQVLCKVTKKVVEICPLPKGSKCHYETIYTHHCNAEVAIVVPTDVKVPNADEIFATTVADSGSTFRKIFPKVEEGAPVECIADMPTVTSVTYNAEESEVPRGGSLEFKVKEIPEDSAGNNPELTFPHIGSIYEYFLKGIQTALRPKGYGEPIANGNCKTTEPVACGGWEDKLEKSGGGNCGICTSELGELAKRILATAGKAYNVPAANIWAAMKHEGGDWDEFRGQYTDENIRKWSTPVECGGEPMPRCDPNDKTSPKSYPPFGFLPYWFYKGEGDGALWTAVQEFDPTRNSIDTVSHCNFLDAAFASAKSLATWSGFARTPASCYGQNLSSSTRPASCNSSAWTDAKIVQSQVGYWIGITPWCPDGTGGPSPLVNNIPIPDYASRVLSNFKSAKCN